MSRASLSLVHCFPFPLRPWSQNCPSEIVGSCTGFEQKDSRPGSCYVVGNLCLRCPIISCFPRALRTAGCEAVPSGCGLQPRGPGGLWLHTAGSGFRSSRVPSRTAHSRFFLCVCLVCVTVGPGGDSPHRHDHGRSVRILSNGPHDPRLADYRSVDRMDRHTTHVRWIHTEHTLADTHTHNFQLSEFVHLLQTQRAHNTSIFP